MLPNIVRLQLEEEYNGDFKYAIFDTHNNPVGGVAISLWPNQPMLYLTQIEIKKDHQDKGLGTATLVALTKLHNRIIFPVQESGSSFDFWVKVRSRGGDLFRVEEQISTTDWSILIRNAP